MTAALAYPREDYRRDFMRLRADTGHRVTEIWRAVGDYPTKARLCAQIVAGAQELVSQMTQVYCRKQFGAQFVAFTAGPDITDRPGVTKEQQYLRPAREPTEAAAVRRLVTMANTDLQLAKTRTFYAVMNQRR